jgi:PAS domain S-box-containing protein
MSEKPTNKELGKRVEELEHDSESKDKLCRMDKIQVSGINIEWNTKVGTCSFEDLPVAMMWVDTTLAGLMSGVQTMVGTERFGLALQSEGRKSVEDDWKVISQFSGFKEGFKAIANIAAVAGWGDWRLISLDEEEKKCRFQIKESWEGVYQKALGVCWGSGMLAGKLGGYCSKYFKTNCWSEQIRFIAKGDKYDEFVVKLSERSIENEIENLLVSDEATRADMAVALEKLRKEVTERRQAEHAMRESEKRYRELVQNANNAIIRWKSSGSITFFNEYAQAFFGYSADEVIGKHVNIIVPETESTGKDLSSLALDIATHPENYVNNINENVCREGRRVWMVWTNKPVFDQNGQIAEILAVGTDISQQKRAEEALKESEKRFHRLFEDDLTGDFLCTPAGKIILCNPAFATIFGFSSPEEAVGTSMLNLYIQPEERNSMLEVLKRQGKLQGYEAWRKRRDGELIHVVENLIGKFTDRGELYEIQGYIFDDTKRKQAEEALRQQAQLLHLSYDAILVWRKDGGIEHWNRGAEQLYGFTESEVLGRVTHKLLKTIHPVPWLEIEAAMRKHGQWEGELHHFAKNGHEVTVSARHQLVLGTDGIERILETNRDITERKKAEKVLLKQAALIDLSPDGVVVKNFDDTVTFWSKGAEKLYGWTKEEAVGRKIIDLLKPVYPHASSLGDVLKKVKVDGKWAGQFVHHAKDGHEIIVMSSWLAMDNKSGGMEILESNTDITEQMRLQSKLEEKAKEVEEYANSMEALAQNRLLQLRDAERLAAIGQTAGMVGHDIRNPLQSILGELYLAKTELSRIHEQDVKNNLAESITNIEKDIYYINKIVEDLQDFAKPIKPVFQEINLEDVCEAVLLKAKIPEKITASCCVEKETKLIVTDPDMLRRVVRNLVNNAMQAMPQGGKLDIRAFKDADDLEMTIEDTGVGISEEAKSKLFTPLFTTKSKGQGFGLAVVKRMTEALGGTVTFESKEGEGTKFILRFSSTKSSG